MTITRRKAKSRVVNEMSEIELGKRFVEASGKIIATPTTCGPFPEATIFLPVCWVGGSTMRLPPHLRVRVTTPRTV
jgi:hypothetical protein